MSLPILLSDEAEQDLLEASTWYAAQKAGLDLQFLDSFEEGLKRILLNPTTAEQPRYDVHRILLRRFPFAVYYVVEPDLIKILAVYHTRRHPRGWQQRKP